MTHKLEFEMVYVCLRCLEECHLAELEEGFTPCCQAKYTKWGIDTRAEFLEWFEDYSLSLKISREELQGIRSYVRTMPSDSKKRRKTYGKVKNKWPGRLSEATTKKGMKADLEKRAPTPKPKSHSVDIIFASTQFEVEIVFGPKDSHTVYGTDRKDARRKARQYLRARGTSITVANAILEEENSTIIKFN